MNHIALRVTNVDAYANFLAVIFDYRVESRHHSEDGRYTIAFMARSEGGSIELIHNWDETTIERGRALAHYGFSTPVYDAFAQRVRDAAVPILEESLRPCGRRQMYVQAPDGMPVEVNEA